MFGLMWNTMETISANCFFIFLSFFLILNMIFLQKSIDNSKYPEYIAISFFTFGMDILSKVKKLSSIEICTSS